VLVVLALASTAAAIKPWTSILEQHLAKAKPIEKTVLAEKEKKKEEAGHGGGDAVYHWGYGEKNGPKTWGNLYSDCSRSRQSPIDIKTLEVDESMHKQPLQCRFPTAEAKTLQVINNGHAIQVQGSDLFDNNGLAHSSTMLNGEIYSLKQFHFHGKAETRIDAKQFPLEAHFVHKDRKGNVLVVAVLFSEGKTDNPVIKALDWGNLKTPKKNTITVDVNPFLLFPNDSFEQYYFYEGSFTTPPCTEGVKWVVMKLQGYASKAQIAAFPFKNNFRPPQPLNGRKVYLSTTGSSLARRMGLHNPDDPNGYGWEAGFGDTASVWDR
jgi:carbonic anhydrase